MTTRLSVNINEETAEALRDLAARKDTTVTEVVRRSVSVLKFLEDEVGRGLEIRTYDPATQEVQTWRLM